MAIETKINLNPISEEDSYLVKPIHYLRYDTEKNEWDAEIQLPGINKSQIKLKILKDLYYLEAKRGNAVYQLTEYFPFEVDVSFIKAEYDNGLLLLSGRILDPLHDAVTIELK